MYRRRLLAAAGLTTAVVAGCLTSDGTDGDGGDNDDSDGSDSNSETDGSEESLPDPPQNAPSGDCPATDAEPPTELSRETAESFVDAFESDWVAVSAPKNATRSGSVSIEAVRVADEAEGESEDEGENENEDENGVDRARVDASVDFSGRGWEGEIVIRPFEDDESAADSDKDDTEAADSSDLERVSTTADPIATSEPVLDAIDHVVDTGESRSITDADSLETLTEAGEYLDNFLIEVEHDDKLLYAENDATTWASHGQWFVGYFLTPDAVYRTEHDPGEWTDNNRSDEPLSVPDEDWKRLECWS
ncbi:uncharacterized protein Nmag_2088 [Natrialba magadii ATCC 43099]|uniref:Uncharacterized protein n=1 Tax=Natrialba magadii (strain ATCC 43099 / DSM 3394 / CCM 3739 / CIP 104546 / IAM 13178 / JCM 8861 / NBRC 102185 / NCIMB 2190 / MS3) TaxID=547559 RepID=D3SVZ6_NATMM|nr:hypothetical protein [Natrialba magadii]ADD05657.1 uncharacterized protein Nmag_2088 [Natrialba magadii ATCC 43099]ELY29931.1 hypothetical protein C500_09984 [Natrialba magadii ATCC 43099]